MSLRRGVIGVALAFTLTQCLDSAGPTAGTLTVALVSAGTNDRAVLVQLGGSDATAAIDTVLPVAGSRYQVFAQRESPSQWRVIVVGNLANGTLLQIGIPNRARASAYTATVLDVADASFAELAPSTLSLTVSP